jgi:hypothetical protein
LIYDLRFRIYEGGRGIGIWSLGFSWCLEIGYWLFELDAYLPLKGE